MNLTRSYTCHMDEMSGISVYSLWGVTYADYPINLSLRGTWMDETRGALYLRIRAMQNASLSSMCHVNFIHPDERGYFP